MAAGWVSVSEADIIAEIKEQAREAAEIKEGLKALAVEAVEFWRSESPVDSGAYAGSVHARDSRKKTEDGLPQMVVQADDYKAHWIEFGTEADEDTKDHPRRVQIDGKWVTLGPDTPTKAFAPRAKTAAHFGGTEE